MCSNFIDKLSSDKDDRGVDRAEGCFGKIRGGNAGRGDETELGRRVGEVTADWKSSSCLAESGRGLGETRLLERSTSLPEECEECECLRRDEECLLLLCGLWGETRWSVSLFRGEPDPIRQLFSQGEARGGDFGHSTCNEIVSNKSPFSCHK